MVSKGKLGRPGLIHREPDKQVPSSIAGRSNRQKFQVRTFDTFCSCDNHQNIFYICLLNSIKYNYHTLWVSTHCSWFNPSKTAPGEHTRNAWSGRALRRAGRHKVEEVGEVDPAAPQSQDCACCSQGREKHPTFGSGLSESFEFFRQKYICLSADLCLSERFGASLCLSLLYFLYVHFTDS